VVPGCQRNSARIAGRDLFQPKVCSGLGLVAVETNSLEVNVFVPATLRHRHDVINLLSQRQATFSLAGLAQPTVATQDAVPYLCPSMARFVAEALVARLGQIVKASFSDHAPFPTRLQWCYVERIDMIVWNATATYKERFNRFARSTPGD